MLCYVILRLLLPIEIGFWFEPRIACNGSQTSRHLGTQHRQGISFLALEQSLQSFAHLDRHLL